jgi:cell wall-associated NlpC family hydrolase
MDLNKYIGIKYSDYNCWELVTLFYRNELNVELPKYYEKRSEDRDKLSEIIYDKKSEYVEVPFKDLRKYDLLLFYVKGVASHIGVYLGRGKFLHTREDIDTVIEALDNWKTKLAGIYRYEHKISEESSIKHRS